MARSTFDFDAVAAKLPIGGFYHSDGDASGNMMVAWGRRQNKFVQLSQAEIASFLAHGHEMLRTDDPAVKAALVALADVIAGSKPRWANLAALIEQVEAGDKEAGEASVELSSKVLGGMPMEQALAEVNADHAPRKGKTPAVRAVPKAS
jgi:hypothetical protein